MNDLKAVRDEKDEFFKHHPQSPLTPAQREVFEKLDYYPEAPELCLEAAVEQFPEQETVEMQTSTGDIQVYQRYGRFTFEVDGQRAALTIFANEHGFFLPFVDAQAGRETYPAGRYLEPQPAGSGKFLVDFNQAYNPYCAYNENWSCPLTPFENRLQVSIRAGEKIFSH